MNSAPTDTGSLYTFLINIISSLGELKGEIQWIISEMQEARREAKEYGELLNFQDAVKN